MNGSDINMVVNRDRGNDQATQGTLTVGGRTMETLELPDRNNRINESRIPAGTYNAHIRDDGDKGYRVELEDVPGRTNIQIHTGNVPRDTTGCILIGTERGDNRVNHSRDARMQLMEEITAAGPGATITVTVNDG